MEIGCLGCQAGLAPISRPSSSTGTRRTSRITQHLLVRQMASVLERFDQKTAADLTYYTYRGLSTLAGGDWRTAPPDPTQAVR